MKKRNLLMTAIAVFGIAMTTLAQVPSYVPTNGLVGYWPFNGNANDESGNGNNGTVTGATLTNDRFGSASSSYNFTYNGWIPGQQKDEIYIPYNAIFNSSSLTVSTWINPSSITYNNGEAYFIARFENGYSNPNGQVWAFAMTPSNSVIAGINQASTTNSQTNTVVYGNPINLNNWVNVIFTYDGSVLKIFQNGFLISSQNNAILINTLSNSGISIGVSRQANGWWYPFDGKIDDIGVWNRALTQQEITDLYNGCQLSVNTEPTNQTINANNNAQFMVGSSDPNATYQWQTDLGVGFQNLNNVGQYTGTTTNTLTVSNVTLSNNNQPFRCIVTSGSCSDTSNVAVLTINNNVGINETSYDNLFSVFPNPAQSVINVKSDSKLIGTIYTIYDNTGRAVMTGKINSENTTIDLGNLYGGVYMFCVGENMKQPFKVSKE